MSRKKTKQAPKRALRLPDLDLAKSAGHCEANALAMSVKTEGV
jgi:hypothetical protein